MTQLHVRPPALGRLALSPLWALALSIVLSAGCDRPPEAQPGAAAVTGGESALEHAEKHLDPSYVCPMHPNVVQDEPGSCPICGMDLVAKPHAGQGETAMEHAKRHLDPNYVCPMHPEIVRDEAGSCPICGMDLVAKELDSAGEEHPAVTLRAAVVQNMGVRTATVERGTLWKYIRTQGKVTYDDDRVIQVHPRTAGWIENLYVRTDGVRVERKDDLADYFSPDVLWAQQEYISSLEEDELSSFGGSGADDPARDFRLRAGVDMLRYLRVPGMDIMGLERSMEPKEIIPIRAPQGGVLVEHNVREGMFVTPADSMFTIVDLSEVWVMVDIFEHQLAWVRPGLTAEVTTPAYPGQVWEGTVEFVYPEVHPKARTLRARLEFKNPDELLLPNMFVEAVIYGGPKRDVLSLPREALILSGEREIVVKALGDGRFQPVEVNTGMWRGDKVEVLSGLDEGDEVVVSGQFLIDSESNLQASFRRMAE
ncbi:MAG: efflux RND transporter periplasmic adaptor subunit [Pseudomonadota bacterium]|nr:efflux RND transporter periplasmic adaptor subunit [Pseudomonadota bacterium]